MRLFWVISVGSKSSDKCPYKRPTKERYPDKQKMKPETGVVQPQAKELLESPEAGRDKEGTPPEPSGEAWPC